MNQDVKDHSYSELSFLLLVSLLSSMKITACALFTRFEEGLLEEELEDEDEEELSLLLERELC